MTPRQLPWPSNTRDALWRQTLRNARRLSSLSRMATTLFRPISAVMKSPALGTSVTCPMNCHRRRKSASISRSSSSGFVYVQGARGVPEVSAIGNTVTLFDSSTVATPIRETGAIIAASSAKYRARSDQNLTYCTVQFSSCRICVAQLRRPLARCFSTVLSAMPICRAISRWLKPPSMRRRMT